MEMSPLEVRLVHHLEVDALWPALRDGFAASCKVSGQYSPGQVWQLCRSGQAFLIIAHEGNRILSASVWRFDTVNDAHSFHCLELFGSDMRRWFKPLRAFVTSIAKENGATRLTACGREKWLRLTGGRAVGDIYEVEI